MKKAIILIFLMISIMVLCFSAGLPANITQEQLSNAILMNQNSNTAYRLLELSSGSYYEYPVNSGNWYEMSSNNVSSAHQQKMDKQAHLPSPSAKYRDPEPLSAAVNSLNAQNFPFVYANVAVRNFGEGISTLNASNFTIYENGVQQTQFVEVTPPESGAGQRLADIVFCLDVSGSMGDAISSVKSNMLSFIQNIQSSGIDYRIGFLTYADIYYVYNNHNLYSDYSQILDIVNNIYLGENGIGGGGDGPENQIGSMAESALFNFRPGAQRVVIMITDAPSHEADWATPWTMQTLINERLLPNNITVFPVFYTSDYMQQQQYIPIANATNTNGTYFDIYDDFTGIISEIGSLVADSYVIRYRTNNPAYDGVLRNVEYHVTYEDHQAVASGIYQPGAAPVIERTPATLNWHTQSWPEGTNITISCLVTDLFEPFTTGARLLYRNTGTANYTNVAMTRVESSDVWQVAINPAYILAPGLDYYFTATDGQTTSSSPAVDPSTSPYQITILPNEAPILTHTPVTQVLQQSSVYIAAFASDSTYLVAEAKLFFRGYGQLTFNSIDMTPGPDGSFDATIPGNVIGINGAEYFIKVTDNFGISTYSGTADNPHQIAILIDGSIIPGGEITDYTWDSDDSPFYIGETIVVTPGNTLIIEPGSVLIFDHLSRLDVLGGLLATGVTFRGSDPMLGWEGIYLESSSTQININNSQIEHARCGLNFQNTNGQVSNTIIQKDHDFTGEMGVFVSGSSSPHFNNVQIQRYSRGMVFDNQNIRISSSPTLGNVRIRNTSSSVRTDCTGLEVTGAVALSIDGAEIEEYDHGIIWDGQGTSFRTTPTLGNVRIRNTSSSVRNASFGMKLLNLSSVIVENDSIGGYPNGLHIENNLPDNRVTSTATLGNVRIRNTSSSVRTDTFGATLLGSIAATISNMEIDDYSTGMYIEGDSTATRTTATATLGNVRIRNTSSSVRSATYGLKLVNVDSVQAISDSITIEGYTNGIELISDGQSRTTTTATLGNVRIRNTSSSVRSETFGVKLLGSIAATLSNMEIDDYTTGMYIEGDSTATRTTTTATLGNVRIRNTSSTVRSETLGVKLHGNILATIDGLDVEDYSTGLYYEGDGTSFGRTTPTLGNVRIRNTSSSVREPAMGIVLKNLAGVNITNSIIYPVIEGLRSNAAGSAMLLDGVPNANIQYNTIWGFATGLSLANSANATFNKSVIWTNGDELTAPIMMDNSNISVTNSDISVTGGVYSGAGNMDKNPLFADPENGNFYPKPRSPLRATNANDTDIGALPFNFDALAAVHSYPMHAGWNLMGVPYMTKPYQNPAANTPVAIFADDLNPFYVAPNYTSIVQMNNNAMPDSLGHIVFNYTGSYNTPAQVRAGVGYWVRNPYNYSTSIDVYGLMDDGSYNLGVPGADGSNNGWYLLANPYDRPIKWADGSMVASGQITPYAQVYDYVGNGFQAMPSDGHTEIPPWSGFFIKSRAATDTLYINYPAASRQIPDNATTQTGLSASGDAKPVWELALQAAAANSFDTVTLGIAKNARDTYDPMDVPKLPAAPFLMNGIIKLSVLNNDWTEQAGDYTRDIRNNESGSWSWNLQLNAEALLVDGRLCESLVLGLNAASRIPAGYRFSLTNLQSGQCIDLSTETMLLSLNIDTQNSPEGSMPWLIPLKLEAYSQNAAISAQQEIISTSNYPNPFNPETTISYNLGKNSPVSLKIYNLKGQLVTSLVNASQNNGLHSVTWNGKDSENRSVASGFYFYRLKAGSSTITRKILMMK